MLVSAISKSLDFLCQIDDALLGLHNVYGVVLCFWSHQLTNKDSITHTLTLERHRRGADRCERGSTSADLGARLQRLGPDGTVPVLTSKLLDLLPGSAGISVPAGSPAMAAHLLATAVANLAQASFGPMQPFEGVPALKPLMSALEVNPLPVFRRPRHLALQGAPAHTLGMIPDVSCMQHIDIM